MKERRGILLLLAIVCIVGVGCPTSKIPRGVIFLDSAVLHSVKQKAADKDPAVAGILARLRERADDAMKDGPWSVTFTKSPAQSGDPHDFFSEGPYWWPDPKHPGGPYIRRDGEVNPDRFTAHDDALGEMSESVLTLGLASALFGEKKYAERAVHAIRVWFIDDSTRMNPHLEYGQAIQGICTGRGIGIIDSRPLVWALEGMSYLKAARVWPKADQAATEDWFRSYLRWLTTSEKGIEEKFNGNNHSTWWAVQAAAMAIALGDRSVQDTVWAFARNYLVPHQIRPDGSCPLEEARTKSLGYSAMNLDAFASLCHLARNQGVDLWHTSGPNGGSIAKAVAYLAPFMENPSAWRKPQLHPFEGSRRPFLLLARIGLDEPEYGRLYRSFPVSRGPSTVIWDLLAEVAQ